MALSLEMRKAGITRLVSGDLQVDLNDRGYREVSGEMRVCAEIEAARATAKSASDTALSKAGKRSRPSKSGRVGLPKAKRSR